MVTFEKYKNFDYMLSLPDGYREGDVVTLLIDIHGAGRRGRDLDLLASAALEKDLTEGRKLPCVVVAPQCFANSWFDIFEQLQDFILGMIEKYQTTFERTVISGTSMGGYATWQLLMALPDKFCRAVICCGGGMYWNAARIRAEVRAYHGSLDDTVYPEESKKMCDAVNRCGGKATWTLFEGLNHNCWDRVFSDEGIMFWLISGKE